MSTATRTAVLLGLAALLVPAVWGYIAYRILDRLWPRPDAPHGRSPRTSPPRRDAEYLDFQI